MNGADFPSGVDLVQWVLTRLARHEEFRQPLPSDARMRAAHVRKLVDAIIVALHPAIIDEYLASLNATGSPTPLPSTFVKGAVLTPGRKVLARFAGTNWLPVANPGERVFAFRALDRQWSVDARAETFLRPLLDGQALAHAQIQALAAGQLPREEVDRVIVRLVREGLLTLG